MNQSETDDLGYDDLGYDPDNPPGSELWEHSEYLPGSIGAVRARLVAEWDAAYARLPLWAKVTMWIMGLPERIRAWIRQS